MQRWLVLAGRKFDRHLRVGDLLGIEGSFAVRRGDYQLWRGQGVQTIGEGEAFVEEQADGDHPRPGVLPDPGLEVSVGVLEDDPGDILVLGAELSRQRRAGTAPIGDHGVVRHAACVVDVVEG